MALCKHKKTTIIHQIMLYVEILIPNDKSCINDKTMDQILKILNITPSGCKHIRSRNVEFVASVTFINKAVFKLRRLLLGSTWGSPTFKLF